MSTSPAALAARDAARGMDTLGWQIVQSVSEGNVVVSPYSLWEALAMTHAGARGETAREIASVLGAPGDVGLGSTARSVRTSFEEAAREVDLRLANRIWIDRNAPVRDAFQALLKEDFAASAGRLNFVDAPEEAREEINDWVDDRTQGHISDLLPPSAITRQTRIVLTNAIYLDAAWAVPFAKHATQPAPFHVAENEKASVPFMNRSARLRSAPIDGGVATEIPYAGGRLAMLVVVPEATDGCASLITQLAKSGVEPLRDRLEERPTLLSLPRFRAQRAIGLADALAHAGMPTAFVPGRADFSGVDGSRDLFLSAVVHEAVVDVTEEGTEAAAATGVAVASRSAHRGPDERLRVNADRPFVWAILDRETDAVLFAGVLRDPRSEDLAHSH